MARARSARKRNGTIYLTVDADVEVDVSEVLSELSDEDLLEEIKDRKLEEKAKAREKLADPFDMLQEVVDCLHQNDAREALFLLDRIMHPKFPSIEACETEFAKRTRADVGGVAK